MTKNTEFLAKDNERNFLKKDLWQVSYKKYVGMFVQKLFLDPLVGYYDFFTKTVRKLY